MARRDEAVEAMRSALTHGPQRVDGPGTGAAVADAFVLLERDSILVEYLLIRKAHADELREMSNGMRETLWGAVPVESEEVPERTVVVCGFDDHGPRTVLVVW